MDCSPTRDGQARAWTWTCLSIPAGDAGLATEVGSPGEVIMCKPLLAITLVLLLIGCARLSPTPGPLSVSSPSSRQILNQGLDAMRFMLSPDREQLALCASDDARIWIVRLASMDRRTIGENGDCNRLYLWHANSREVVFLRESPSGSGKGAVIAAEADTGRSRVIAPGPVRDLALSPDGHTLALVSEAEGSRVLSLMDWDTSRVNRVTRGAIGGLAWSPDSRRLLFGIDTLSEDARLASPRGSDSGYFLVYDLTSGQQKRITPEFKQLGSALWSPDGRWIAFNAAGERAQDLGIYLMAADGERPDALAAGAGASIAEAWSLTGDSLLFTRRGAVDGGPNSGLWRYDLNERTVVRLAVGNIKAALYSPDGKRIAFSENSRLSVITAAEGATRVVAESAAQGDWLPSFQWVSPSSLVHLDRNGSIIRIQLPPG